MWHDQNGGEASLHRRQPRRLHDVLIQEFRMIHAKRDVSEDNFSTALRIYSSGWCVAVKSSQRRQLKNISLSSKPWYEKYTALYVSLFQT